MEVNKWSTRAFHVSNIKMEYPQIIVQLSKNRSLGRVCVSKVCKVNFEPNLE